MKQLITFIIFIGLNTSLFGGIKSFFGLDTFPEHEPISIEKITLNKAIAKKVDNGISIVSPKYRIDGKKIISIPNRGYYVIANTIQGNDNRGVMIVKFTESNTIDWINLYKANEMMISTKIFHDDNGLLVSGYYSTFKTLTSPFIFKVDFSGDIKWAKDYNERNMVKSFTSVIKVSDGYMATGNVKRGIKVSFKNNMLHFKPSNTIHNVWITKLDFQGNQIWDKIIENKTKSFGVHIEPYHENYSIITVPIDNPQEIIISSDGKIISKNKIKNLPYYLENQYNRLTKISRYKSIVVKKIGNNKFEINKLDNNKSVLWTYAIINESQDAYGDSVEIVETSDGGCLINNFQYGFLQGSTFLIKLDKNGNEKWKKNYHSKKGRFVFNNYTKIGSDRYLFLATKTFVENAEISSKQKEKGIVETKFNLSLLSGLLLVEVSGK